MRTTKDFQLQMIHQGLSMTGLARTRTGINITAIHCLQSHIYDVYRLLPKCMTLNYL